MAWRSNSIPVAYIFFEPMFLLCCTSGRYGYLLGGFRRWEMASRSYVFLCLPCSVGLFKPMAWLMGIFLSFHTKGIISGWGREEHVRIPGPGRA